MGDKAGEQAGGTYRRCQSLVRGLELLAAMNRCTNGSSTVYDLSQATGLHRTTVKRFLETLREEGYVLADPASNQYRLTSQVQQLSYGFKDNVAVTDVAWPVLRELSQNVVWPCSLVTLEGDEMVVRVSTRTYSPLSFHPGTPGRRLPILVTAAGRAYLANASKAEQDVILAMLREREDFPSRLARDERLVARLLLDTKKRGYALNEGEWTEEPRFGGIAVPVFQKKRVVACINLVYLLRGIAGGPGIKKLADELMSAARLIESRWTEIPLT